jgi:hypothetical protein
MKRSHSLLWVLLCLALAHLACNAPVPIPLTGTSSTLTPVLIGTTGTPPAGTPAACSNKITFVSDVTIPDNTPVNAGKAFTKTWRVRNDGTCTWGPTGYPVSGLVYTGGDQMGGPKEIPLPAIVKPGETVDISLQLTAPTTPGNYVGQWMFRVNDSSGNAQPLGVGDRGKGPLYVQIIVK